VSHALAAVAGSVLILITFPGSISLALLTLGGILPPARRRPCASGAARTTARLAVVIPAHNEASTILRCVRSLAACTAPGEHVVTSIVVVADNCNDATAELARSAGARVIVRAGTKRRGKGFALQEAFERLLTEGFDAVVVIDADTVVAANLLVEIVRLLDAGADGVQTRYGVLNPEAAVRVRLMNVALMAFNVLRPRGRERMGLSAGILGNGFALSKATLETVPYQADSIVEDLEYHLRLVRFGRKISFADRTIVRAEMPPGGRGAATQRARWEGGRLRMIAQNVPALAREVVKGNFRLFEPMLELLLLPLTFHVLILAGTAAIPFAPGRIYALAALALVAVHVSAGVIVGGGDERDFAALLAVPFYIAWKLTLSPYIFRSARRNAEWIRTQRAGARQPNRYDA